MLVPPAAFLLHQGEESLTELYRLPLQVLLRGLQDEVNPHLHRQTLFRNPG